MGAHFLALFGGGGHHYQRGVLEGISVRVWVEEAGGGDVKAFGIADGGLEIDK